jgi:hypothetical protein
MEMMNRFVPVFLISLLATSAAAPMAFAGAARVSVPEPSSLALLAGGMGIVYLVHKMRRRK